MLVFDIWRLIIHKLRKSGQDVCIVIYTAFKNIINTVFDISISFMVTIGNIVSIQSMIIFHYSSMELISFNYLFDR